MESCRELKENNPYLFNSWRSILYTEKGRKAGVVDEWRKFPTFYKDVHETYKEGLRLCRKDKNKPFGPNNFEWVTNLELAQTNTQTIKLTYNGETKTLREWSEEYGMSYNGLLLRYVRNKNYTIEEILFGKKRKPKSKSREYNLYTRASKLLSAYKLKDWKSNREFNLDRNWFVDNILKSQCIYCGSKEKLGCDRIDNFKGHTYDNVVPCCYIMVNGRNVIPKSFATLVTTKGLVGFTCRRVDDTTRGKSVLIKQIPEYEGALVFDGVDDYGICENFPALNDFTFVYKRINLNPSKSTNCFLSKSTSTNQAQQFCSELAYSQNTYVRLGNKDIAIKDVYNPELSIVYVTKESYNGEMNLASSNYTSTVDDLYIGTFSRGIQAYVWKGALYAIDIYDRTLNSDELQIALQNIEK